MRRTRGLLAVLTLLAYLGVLVSSYGHAASHLDTVTYSGPASHAVSVNLSNSGGDAACSLCQMLQVFGASALTRPPEAPVPTACRLAARTTDAPMAARTGASRSIRGPPTPLPV